jgi:hypothetical protein
VVTRFFQNWQNLDHHDPNLANLNQIGTRERKNASNSNRFLSPRRKICQIGTARFRQEKNFPKSESPNSLPARFSLEFDPNSVKLTEIGSIRSVTSQEAIGSRLPEWIAFDFDPFSFSPVETSSHRSRPGLRGVIPFLPGTDTLACARPSGIHPSREGARNNLTPRSARVLRGVRKRAIGV